MKRSKQYYSRKVHRWLGLIIGIQFIGWTVSGLYFSWTDLDQIHGDHFLLPEVDQGLPFSGLPTMDTTLKIRSLEWRNLGGEGFLWVNDSVLVHAKTGEFKTGIDETAALQIAKQRIKPEYQIKYVELLTEVGPHHEYRERPLPVWAIHYEGSDHMVAYISQRDGLFQRVRHRSWRWFDNLWMLHTMDYQTRDNFNTLLLRAFSVFGLLTVASGFVLFGFTLRRKRKATIISA